MYFDFILLQGGEVGRPALTSTHCYFNVIGESYQVGAKEILETVGESAGMGVWFLLLFFIKC